MRTSILSTFAVVVALSACSDTEKLPEGHPADRTYYSHTGLFAKSKVAVSTNQTVSWVQHVLANYKRKNTTGIPSTILPLPIQKGCSFQKPASGSKVAYVHVTSAFPVSQVYAITDKSVRSGAKSIIKQMKQFGEVKDQGRVVSGTADALNVIDLAVTDTSQPLHLVLAAGDNRLWNLHLRPGVEVSGISLIGGSTAAVAGLNAPVKMSYLGEEQLEKCNVPISRRPTKKWKLMSNGKDSSKFHGKYNRFAAWFSKTFGPIDPKTTVDAMSAWHALYGPAPRVLDERQPHHSLDGATIYAAQTADIFAATEKEYGKRKWRAAQALAKRLSGGS